jgi:hypothetical protein
LLVDLISANIQIIENNAELLRSMQTELSELYELRETLLHPEADV